MSVSQARAQEINRMKCPCFRGDATYEFTVLINETQPASYLAYDDLLNFRCQTGCPTMSVTNYKCTPRKVPEVGFTAYKIWNQSKNHLMMIWQKIIFTINVKYICKYIT